MLVLGFGFLSRRPTMVLVMRRRSETSLLILSQPGETRYLGPFTGSDEQFFLENVEYNARRALQKLEHIGSVRDYVKSFSVLMLDIRDMLENDKLFTFIEGLRPNKPHENKQGAPQKSSGCFLCDGTHRYCDCPKKQLLNAMTSFTDKAPPPKPMEPQASASGGNDSEEDVRAARGCWPAHRCANGLRAENLND
ncbi:UNVERIFIED_CONTAM: hypothetical protein Slati_2430900 [Sesamum latifolium]|uniref:Retrotransposon gag domain-containing protein n=1 Tax=Sesamum latifolium TaxID=2727402 RepID=A0AAW2WCM3_9LAMI